MTALENSGMNEVGSLSEQDVDGDFSRLSRMAVAGFAVSLLSILSLVTGVFIPLCLIAIAVSLVAAIRILRNNSLGGLGLAQAGLAIGSIFFCWSTMSALERHRFYYDVAGRHAATYLSAIANGDTYVACELQKSEPQRQITGTNLAAIYENEALDDKGKHDRLLKSAATQKVLQSGPDARWQLAEGLRIVERHPFTIVTVAMENEANPDDGRVLVVLRREVERFPKPGSMKAALWSVDASRLPDDEM